MAFNDDAQSWYQDSRVIMFQHQRDSKMCFGNIEYVPQGASNIMPVRVTQIALITSTAEDTDR